MVYTKLISLYNAQTTHTHARTHAHTHTHTKEHDDNMVSLYLPTN